jgi:hypothetical protein
MLRKIDWKALALAGAALVLLAPPAARAQIPHDRSSPAPPPVADKTGARALELVQGLAAGNLDRTELSDSLNAILDQSTIDGYKRQLSSLGAPSKAILTARNRDPDAAATRYVYKIVFAGASAYLTFAIDDGTQKVSVLYLRPGPPPL